MPRSLPPLNALRACEAAARLGSFKAAAGVLADMRDLWIARVLGNDLIDPDAVMAPFAAEVLARAAAFRSWLGREGNMLNGR